jgi:hypothetical protein
VTITHTMIFGMTMRLGKVGEETAGVKKSATYIYYYKIIMWWVVGCIMRRQIFMFVVGGRKRCGY